MAHYHPDIDVQTIVAGKFRRYHSVPVWQQMLHFRTIGFPNVVDFIKTILGIVQSITKLIIWRPDVVFTKGGFVCLPVGIAAKSLGIPLAIHESDAHSGLTNRILARWATVIGTGAPTENYAFPARKTHYIGIPIILPEQQRSARAKAAKRQNLGFSSERPLVVVTGGGLGAQRINDAVVTIAPSLAKHCNVLLVSGTLQYDEIKKATAAIDAGTFILRPYVEGLVDILAVADVVVSRAGATTLLELAALAKPTVLIPNGRLTGGHQLKNAAVYDKKEAVVMIDEDALQTEPELLEKAIVKIAQNESMQKKLSESIAQFAKPYAAKDMAHLVIAAAKKR